MILKEVFPMTPKAILHVRMSTQTRARIEKHVHACDEVRAACCTGMAACHFKGGGHAPQRFHSLPKDREQGGRCGLRRGMEHLWHVAVYIYIYIYIDVYVYVCMYVGMYVCMYVCIYIYIYTITCHYSILDQTILSYIMLQYSMLCYVISYHAISLLLACLVLHTTIIMLL